ncbi:MAG: glucose-1-phosphate adenylyltransferase subunit GlgD, partial [Lachnospiraceae bacterium]|nr:glucose-1-phosphate adenylyltransferase subunit GlgD [Lachnospiraceae bacterium]
SSLVNCGIDNITILARENYFSLLDHLGSGREWDLSRKNGGLNIFPPYAQKSMGVYGGRIEGIASILAFLKRQKEQYVILSDTNLAVNFDFKALVASHIESGADVTVAYTKEEIPVAFLMAEPSRKDMYFTFEMDGDTITKLHINEKMSGVKNLGMNMYVIDRKFLIDIVEEAFVAGGTCFERDILLPKMSELKVHGYEYTGYLARITSLKSYFDENMKLLNDENLDGLFSANPVYTKIRDDNPTRYIGDAKATNVMVADGCVIEGEVENCVLFRGVKVGKGARVKNCILMQDTVIEPGAKMEYVITDKKVTISERKTLQGSDTFPVFVTKTKVV